MVDISVQRKTVNLIIIIIWKEVYVVGQVDADFSGSKSDDSESDKDKRRDRRGYIDTISKPAHFRDLYIQNCLKMELGINQIGITFLFQLLFPIVMQLLRTE